MDSLLSFCCALLIAPLFPAVIQKVKAWFGGKQGPPLLINYYTLLKLLQKGSVYSTSTSFVFRLGPIISAATGLMLLLFFLLPEQLHSFLSRRCHHLVLPDGTRSLLYHSCCPGHRLAL